MLWETHMSKRSLGTSIVLVGLAVALSATLAFADSQVRIVRLSNVEGAVQVDRNTGQGYENAFLNMPIVQGMKLATKSEGRAEVEFEDGSTVRITPKTAIEFSDLALRDSGARVSAVTVQAGLAYVNYTAKHEGDEFTVLFAKEKVQPQHAAHFRVEVAADAVLAVFSGELRVEGPSGDVEVGKNKSATFDLVDTNKFSVAKNIEDEPFDAWDKQQSKYQQAYARRGSNNDYPYGYGVSDLNYYGSYSNVAGYGMMWQPYFTGVGWSPFSDGAWMFYPGAGYMWVSSYPWGWMPYRYGAWTFVPGYGWMWAPGGWGGGWYGVPPVRNPPNRFPTPQPPARGTATVVVGHPVVAAGGPPRRVVVENGTAGLGIPRGTVSNLGKVSREVRQNGFAMVRTSPPSRGMGTGSTGWSGATGVSHGSSGSSSRGHGSTSGGRISSAGSSGGHSAPPSRPR
jgi:hypothetical protein